MTGLSLVVTGATGFIGAHVVASALARGHRVMAVGRDAAKAAAADWSGRAEFRSLDLHDPGLDAGALVAGADAMLHLAWPGLKNFRDSRHVTRWLPADARFLSAALEGGLPRLLVAGTCLEYGLQSGCLGENAPTDPSLAYPIAKDALRRFLFLRPAAPVQWARLFYLHGRGQSPNSLLAQLDAAIEAGDESFPMSGGAQLRDYLAVETVAERLVRLVETPSRGVFNLCSGEPISVRALVERRLAERGATLRLDLGRYPYPDYEPMAFWGDGAKLARAIGQG